MISKSAIFKHKWLMTATVLFLVLLIGILLVYGHVRPKPLRAKAVDVDVSTVVSKTMPIELKMPGAIEAAQSVKINAQVSGIIKKIDFVPGQTVQAGQLLFEIDPASFQAKLDQVKQNLIKDQAQLTNTLSDKQRMEPLLKKGFVSQQEYDQVSAQANIESAVVKSDAEQIKAAQIQLDYTRIQSPIAGKTGNVALKVGDLVTAESAAPLVTVNQLNPVMVNFYLPQHKLPQVLAYQKQHPITLKVFNEKNTRLLGQGTLTFIDNTVNPATGMILLKGTIANTQHLLWPAQMVTVKLILAMQEDAVVIPSQAVKMDDTGAFVYKVEQGRAWLQRIRIDRQLGDETVVKQGVKAGDVIIAIVPPSLEDGTPVHTITTPASPAHP